KKREMAASLTLESDVAAALARATAREAASAAAREITTSSPSSARATMRSPGSSDGSSTSRSPSKIWPLLSDGTVGLVASETVTPEFYAVWRYCGGCSGGFCAKPVRSFDLLVE